MKGLTTSVDPNVATAGKNCLDTSPTCHSTWQVSITPHKISQHTFENFSSAQLAKAAALKERIENLHHELSQILGGSSSSQAKPSSPSGKRTMSAAGRARIAAAARKRWARSKDSGSKGAAPANDASRLSVWLPEPALPSLLQTTPCLH